MKKQRHGFVAAGEVETEAEGRVAEMWSRT